MQTTEYPTNTEPGAEQAPSQRAATPPPTETTMATSDDKPALVIYHAKCADGFSAAWVFHHHHQRTVVQRPYPEFVPGRYGYAAPDVAGRDVYLVDFSYKRAVVADMLQVARSVTLIDHHQTAIHDLQGLPGLVAYTDLQRSGATLAWDYLFPGQPRPLLLGHIEDRDLWRFKLPHTREIQSTVFSLDYTFDNWDKLMAANAHDLVAMTAQGAAIERKHRKDVAELVDTCRRRITIAGHSVPCASLPFTMASDGGELLAQGEPFAAVYWDTADHRQFSLRSRGDGLDVATIAEGFGGGGHRNAAGFRVTRDHELARV